MCSFCLELLERGHRVDADREDHRVGGLELRVVVGEGAHLRGAGLRERQRKEREQHVPPAQLRERHVDIGGGRQGEIRRGRAHRWKRGHGAQAPFARSYRRATSVQLTTFHHAAR